MRTAQDRRVRRTRHSLHQALIATILDKGYGRATVQDILDRADVGRSTFYAHYANKDDLFREGGLEHLRDLLANDTSRAGDSTPVLPPALALFRLADGNRQLYKALIGRRGSELVLRAARSMLTDIFAEHLRGRLATNDQRQLDIAATFLANGLTGLLLWWLDGPKTLSSEEVYAHFEALAIRGVAPLLPSSS
jgi:AcrR family transcriptional regulator